MKAGILILLALVTFVSSLPREMSPDSFLSLANNPKTGRIFGGHEVARHSIPYQVAVYSHWASTLFCGGTLVNKRWVLSSSFCKKNPGFSVNIVLGAHNLYQVEPSITIEADAVYLHDDYLSNDIALFHLSKDAEINEVIQIVNLARFKDVDYTGVRLRISGWGSWNGNTLERSHFLRETFITGTGIDECSNEIPTGYSLDNDTLLCASVSEVGPCRGDAGGPVVDMTTGEQIGMILDVWSDNCYGSASATVYIKIPYFIDWIEQHYKS